MLGENTYINKYLPVSKVNVLLNVMEHLELEKRFDLNDKTTNYTVNSTIAKSKFNLLSFLVAAKLVSAAILPQ